MDELLSVTNELRNKIVNVTDQKKIVKKRDMPLEEKSLYFNENEKSKTTVALLCSDTYATFTSEECAFYKLLRNKVEIHQLLTTTADYKVPYTDVGFKFKPVGTHIYYDKHNTQCMPDTLYGKKCLFTYVINPYDYNNGSRNVGICIKISKIIEKN